MRDLSLAGRVVLPAMLLAALSVCPLWAAPRTVPTDDILVSAAASLTDALTDIAHTYEQQTGTHVALNFGPSSSLARQIVNGGPVDVFVSADEAQMDVIANAKLLDAASRVDLLSNQLVIVMPSGAKPIASAKALTADAVRHVALANPDAVPAGVYAKQYLQSRGLWSAIASKVVPTLDVRAALAAVESGNADAAFVYRTDAAIARGAVIVFRVPIPDGPRIVYPAAVLKAAPHVAAAHAFFDFLSSAKPRAIFERFGFAVPDAR